MITCSNPFYHFDNSVTARRWAEKENYDFAMGQTQGLAIFPGAFCPPNQNHISICKSVLKDQNINNIWMDLSKDEKSNIFFLFLLKPCVAE